MAEGYETQREAWEKQYAEAQARYEAHVKQVAAGAGRAEAAGDRRGDVVHLGAPVDSGGTLASDEALAAAG